MTLTVEFVTLGDASEKLEVPSATLRHWTDQLEDLDCHFTKRNNRNERIYYENDLEIFAFLRDLKAEYGRKTTTRDLAYMIKERGDRGDFELRSREEAPMPKPSNKTAELLGQEDIKRLMESERVKQFMQIIVKENTENLKDVIREEVKQEVMQVNQTTIDTYQQLEKTLKDREDRIDEKLKQRDEMLMKYFRERDEQRNKGFFSKLFGK